VQAVDEILSRGYEDHADYHSQVTAWKADSVLLGEDVTATLLTHTVSNPPPSPICIYIKQGGLGGGMGLSTVYTPLSGVPRFPIPRSANSDSPLEHHDLFGKERLRRRCRAPLKAILCLMALRLKACILYICL